MLPGVESVVAGPVAGIPGTLASVVGTLGTLGTAKVQLGYWVFCSVMRAYETKQDALQIEKDLDLKFHIAINTLQKKFETFGFPKVSCETFGTTQERDRLIKLVGEECSRQLAMKSNSDQLEALRKQLDDYSKKEEELSELVVKLIITEERKIHLQEDIRASELSRKMEGQFVLLLSQEETEGLRRELKSLVQQVEEDIVQKNDLESSMKQSEVVDKIKALCDLYQEREKLEKDKKELERLVKELKVDLDMFKQADDNELNLLVSLVIRLFGYVSRKTKLDDKNDALMSFLMPNYKTKKEKLSDLLDSIATCVTLSTVVDIQQRFIKFSDQFTRIVTKEQDTHTHSVSPRKIIGRYYNSADQLIGRNEDFKTICEKLLNKQSVAIIGERSGIEIEGEGGIGKTALANIIAHDVAHGQGWKDVFPDGVIFAYMGLRANVNDQMIRLAEDLEVDLKPEEGERLAAPEVRKRIKEKMSILSVLFIIDDVWEQEQLNLFVGVLGPNSRYLITSRLLLMDIQYCVPIGALSKGHSIELLRRTLNDSGYSDVSYELLKKMAFVARGVPQCLIALANQMVVRKEHVGESKSFEYVFIDICGVLVVEMQYKDIQDRAFYFLSHILMRNSKQMVKFIKSISVFTSSEEGIPRSVLDALCLGLDIQFKKINFPMLAKLDFLKMETLEGVVSKLFFHDLQVEFAQIVVGQELKDYHRFMIQGYHKQSSGLFYNIKDEYFLAHFIRHLKDGHLTDFIEEMVKDGALAVWLWEVSGYRRYLVELLKIGSETLDDVDNVNKVLRILEERIDPNGQSLLFTMSCFLDSNSPYIESMVNFIQKRNEPVAIADFIYEKEEGSIPCLFSPEVTSKLVIAKTKNDVLTVFDHSLNQIYEIECLHAIPSEDSRVIVIQKKSLKGDLIQILDSELVKVDEIEVPGDIDYCRSVSNDGRFINFHSISPDNSYLLDMNRRKMVKFINMRAVVAPNGLFFVIHSGNKIWVIPVDWINGRDVHVVVGDLEGFSSFECKEHVRGIRLSNNHVFVRLAIETSIIEIDSNLSFGLKKEVKGAILSTYSNYLVTTRCCYDILKSETICPVCAYPLESSNGLNWLERDVGTKSIRLYKEIPTSHNGWQFFESVSYLARHNETNFVELIRKDDSNQTLRYDIDVSYVALSDSDYLAIQTKSLNIFVFDLNSSHCVNLGKQGGVLAFSNDSKYLFFFGSNDVMRWTLSELNWYDGNGLPESENQVESKEFMIPGVIKAAFYPIINTILSFNDGWIFKHPVEDPDKRYPVMEWPLVAPLFSMSPKNDCFSIYCRDGDGKSLVLFDNSYQVINSVISLTRIAGVTCCNSIHFLSLLTPSEVFRLPYPFLVDHIFSSNDKLILCHDDKMFPVIVKGPTEEESPDPHYAWVVDQLKKAFTKPTIDEESVSSDPRSAFFVLIQSLLRVSSDGSQGLDQQDNNSDSDSDSNPLPGLLQMISQLNSSPSREDEQDNQEDQEQDHSGSNPIAGLPQMISQLNSSFMEIIQQEELTEEEELEMAIRMSMESIQPKDELTEDEQLELALRMSMEDLG